MKRTTILFLSFLCGPFVFGQHFSFTTKNPFGLEYFMQDSTKAALKLLFYDVDSDGDQDVIIIGFNNVFSYKKQTYSSVKYFIDMQENTGTKLQPVFASRKPYADTFPYPNGYFAPAVGDLNKDSHPDFIICCGVDSSLSLKTQYFEKKSVIENFQYNIFDSDSLHLTNFARGAVFLPELADMDLDGDLDLLMNGYFTELSAVTLRREITSVYLYAKNIGTLSSPIFDGWYHNPYGLIPDENPQSSLIGDIDNDGDNDILSLIKKSYQGVTDNLGYFSFIENIPQPNGKPHFLAGVKFPFGLPTANETESLYGHSLVDIDADGDLDLFVIQKLMGSEIGIGYYENNLCSASSIAISQQICEGDSVIVGTNIFKTSGSHYVTIEKPGRCDSIVHLSLTVLPVSQQILNKNICPGESYTVGNQTFDQSGQYTVTLRTIEGCDSIVTLNLTVVPNDFTDLTISICEGTSVSVGNDTFNQTGKYDINLSSINGCDSVIHLDLTVFQTSATNIASAICQGSEVIIGNQSFNQTGKYDINLSSINGCDSMVHLDLKVNPTATTNLVKTLCSGSSYVIGNQSFTQSGLYEVKLKTIYGCDSVVNAALTFITLDGNVTESLHELTANQHAASYQWFDCTNNTDIDGAINQTFKPVKNGKYGVRITDTNSCQITSACYDFVLSGIEVLILSNRITLFPNPSDDYFTILNNTGYTLTGIKIINSTGITERILPNYQIERISTAGLSQGMYIIEMVCNGSRIYKKLAVK